MITKSKPTPLLKALLFEKRFPQRYISNKLLFKIVYGLNLVYPENKCVEGIISEIFGNNCYCPNGFEIKNKDTIIDIGANVGVFSLYASKKAQLGKIYSFEPFKENYEFLIKNLKLNKLKNIFPFNLGVSPKNKKEVLYISDTNCGACNNFKGKGEKIVINCISLKDIFDLNNIQRCNFMKIDCEGAEYDILFNTPQNYLDRIDKISMEYHNLDKKRNKKTLLKFLEKIGFKIKGVVPLTEKVGMIYVKR